MTELNKEDFNSWKWTLVGDSDAEFVVSFVGKQKTWGESIGLHFAEIKRPIKKLSFSCGLISIDIYIPMLFYNGYLYTDIRGKILDSTPKAYSYNILYLTMTSKTEPWACFGPETEGKKGSYCESGATSSFQAPLSLYTLIEGILSQAQENDEINVDQGLYQFTSAAFTMQT